MFRRDNKHNATNTAPAQQNSPPQEFRFRGQSADPHGWVHDSRFSFNGASGRLNPSEVWWSTIYDKLHETGYTLGQRYRPGNQNLAVYNSGGVNPRGHSHTRRVIAATANDGRVIAIKHIVNDVYPDELVISVKMCVKKIREKGNPCVPIIHYFSIAWERTARPPSDFIVMPLLTRFDDPPFHNVKEVLDFVQQALQGLKYLQANYIAHLNLTEENIMFDATQLYRNTSDRGHPSGHVSQCTRSEIPSGVKYYIVNFNKARDVTPKSPIQNFFMELENCRIELPVPVRHDENFQAPELLWGTRINSFAVDVYSLGKVFFNRLVSKYRNLKCIELTVDKMTRPVPTDRVYIHEALEAFERGIRDLTHAELSWRLQPRDESVISLVYNDASRHVTSHCRT